LFKNKWWIVVASVLALIVGNGVINVYAAGVFIKPLAKELGFGRGVISSAIAWANIATAIAMPFVGRLFDRYGVRAVLLPAIALFALATATRSLLTGSVVLLFLIFAFSGVTGAAQSGTAYSKMIAARFDTRRGLALGIALAGIGLGAALIPQLCNIFLRVFGWRGGFVVLGVLTIILAFIPVAVFCREQGTAGGIGNGKLPATDVPGLSFSEALRTWPLWALWLVFFFSTIAINGSLIQVIPMLTDRGITVAVATAALSFSGLALIAGRLLSGYLLDKLYAPYIGMFFLLLAMTGLGILALGVRGAGPVLGTILLGMGMGAEIDLLAYVIACYFGIKAFGAIHGLIFAGALIANGIGAATLGWLFQIAHSYTAGLIAFEILLAISVILFGTLGAYRYPAARHQKPKPQPAVAAGI
jgi:MFS family permease